MTEYKLTSFRLPVETLRTLKSLASEREESMLGILVKAVEAYRRLVDETPKPLDLKVLSKKFDALEALFRREVEGTSTAFYPMQERILALESKPKLEISHLEERIATIEAEVSSINSTFEILLKSPAAKIMEES